MLKLYRLLLWFVAGIGLLVAFTGFAATMQISRNSFVAGLTASIPGLVIALGAGVLAELITLFVRIEHHLDEMKQEQRRTNSILAGGSGTQPEVDGPVPLSDSSTVVPPGALTGTAMIYRRVTLYTLPDKSHKWGTVNPDYVAVVFGRTRDNQWLSVHQSGRLWASASDFSVNGDISTLPVINPPTHTV